MFFQRRPRLTALFILLCLSVFSPHGHAAELRCLPALQQLRADFSGGVLNASELQNIKAIYENPKLLLAKKNQQAFAIYLEARLRMLPKQTAADIRELLARRTYFNRYGKNSPRPDPEDYHNGFYDPDDSGLVGKDSIAILLPNSLRHSLVHYMTLVHEIEHAVQWYAIRKLPRRYFWQRSPLAEFDHPKAHFLCESGAMLAEWSFGHAIPAKFRRHLAQRLARDPREDPEANELSVRTLRTASLGGEAFLVNEWANHRYSEEDIAEEAALRAELDRWRPLDCWWYLVDLIRRP